MRALLATLTALALAPAAAGATVERSAFRYARPLDAPGSGPILLDPDGPLWAHARPDLSDLRVLDAAGRQVPWRPLPEPAGVPPQPVPVLDSGRTGSEVTALLDLGPRRRVHDHIELDLAGGGFVGRVTVLGSDDRRTFTRLSTTTVFDLAGARPARSTTLVFPPTDYRYLQLRGRGIPLVHGATVSGVGGRPALRTLPARMRVRQRAAATIVVLDLGHRGVPVDGLRLTAATPSYDRAVEVGGTYGRVVRTGEVHVDLLPVAARGRFVRLRIENGDDAPLRGLRVAALARPRTLLVERGRAPLTVLYGARVAPPSYDYALLPRNELRLATARRGALGPERPNPAYAPPADTRGLIRRHPALLEAVLGLAAGLLVLGGVLTLRRV